MGSIASMNASFRRELNSQRSPVGEICLRMVIALPRAADRIRVLARLLLGLVMLQFSSSTIMLTMKDWLFGDACTRNR